VENFGWNFSANRYSSPDSECVSSGALVTAAETVQIFETRAHLDNITTTSCAPRHRQPSATVLKFYVPLIVSRSQLVILTGAALQAEGRISRSTDLARKPKAVAHLVGTHSLVYTYRLP
jgi:hypothetical protein